MKQRKTFITLVLVLAVAGLAVAYAINPDLLTITGTATASTDDGAFVVKFADGQTTVTGTNATGAVDAQDPTKATITVSGLDAKDEYATINFKVKNASPELGAQLAVVSEGTHSLFTVEPTVASTLAAGGETDVTVRVTLKNAVASEVVENISIKLTATAVNPIQ